jgi:hypothetical protein
MKRSPSTTRPSSSLSCVDAAILAAPDARRCALRCAVRPASARPRRNGVQRGVEVVGVAIQIRLFGGRRGEAALAGHHAGQALLTQRAQRRVAHPAVLAPQAGRTGQVVEIAKGVEEALALGAPVTKLDAELEGAIGGAQELGLVNADPLVIFTQHGKGGLAHADDADLFRFDQFDRAARQRGDQPNGSHPAGRAAADDDDAFVCGIHVLMVRLSVIGDNSNLQQNPMRNFSTVAFT